MPEPRPCRIAGQREQATSTLSVEHPYDGSAIADIAVPDADQVERAVQAAWDAAAALRRTPADHRAAALDHVAAQLHARADEVAELITAESGKPITLAHTEVSLTARACRTAADETRGLTGELHRVDTGGECDLIAMTERKPRGPVLSMTSFAFPLAAAARNVAAALAAGSPIVLKPAERTPLSALLLGDLLSEAELCTGACSVLPISREATIGLLADDRMPTIAYSGSAQGADEVSGAATHKRVVPDIRRKPAAVVLDDWHDLETAARRIAASCARQAGQTSAAVQRVLVARTRAEEFLPLLRDATQAQACGNPYDETVEVGPLVDEAGARVIGATVDEAVAGGASILAGGTCDGSSMEPTVLVDVPGNVAMWTSDVLGPVLAVRTVDSVEQACTEINEVGTGAHVGIFTRDVYGALEATHELDTAGVVIGDAPPSYAVTLPPGRIDGSIPGELGVLAAMHAFTTERAVLYPSSP